MKQSLCFSAQEEATRARIAVLDLLKEKAQDPSLFDQSDEQSSFECRFHTEQALDEDDQRAVLRVTECYNYALNVEE